MADSEADTASIISASTNASTKGRSSSRHKSSKSKDKIRKKKRKNPSLLGPPKQKSTRMRNVSPFVKNFAVKASTLQILSLQVSVS